MDMMKMFMFFVDMYNCLKEYLVFRDYSIESVWVHYTAMKTSRPDLYEDIVPEWATENRLFWDEDYAEHCMSIKHPSEKKVRRLIDLAPEECTVNWVETKYYYNNTLYKYIAIPDNFMWPPPGHTGASFFVPIQKAVLCSPDDDAEFDITTQTKRVHGPRGNFHGAEFPIKTMFSFDDETLKAKFPILKITNLLGTTWKFDTLKDTLGPQSLAVDLPAK
jgi:hypothetical protein